MPRLCEFETCVCVCVCIPYPGKKGIEIKLYPNKAQKVFFAKTFGCCRFVYNQCLRIKSYIYEETKMPFQPKLKSFKEEWPSIGPKKQWCCDAGSLADI